jgi:hypothetical protein
MDTDDLGDRMMMCERMGSGQKLMPLLPVLARTEGRLCRLSASRARPSHTPPLPEHEGAGAGGLIPPQGPGMSALGCVAGAHRPPSFPGGRGQSGLETLPHQWGDVKKGGAPGP